eukprot:m.34337 g.34337  ORF g.34337 m.34337 type:complete len:169 (-) comp43488_c0_seq1:428-934(-)
MDVAIARRLARVQHAPAVQALTAAHGPLTVSHLCEHDIHEVAAFIGSVFDKEDPSSFVYDISEAENIAQSARRLQGTLWVEQRVGIHLSVVVRFGGRIVAASIAQPPYPHPLPAEFSDAFSEATNRKAAAFKIVFDRARSLGYDLSQLVKGLSGATIKELRGDWRACR